MTVVDFRSGGYGDSSHSYPGREGAADWGVQDDDVLEGHGWAAQDWDETRYATHGDGLRLTDQDGVLGRVARLTHYLGALVSVFLMASLAVWGYQLVVRDVSGVPVIRAVEGDSRIAPADPGGVLSDREGLAVNGVAGGTGAGQVEKVALAPGATALDGQDVAMGELGASAREAVAGDEFTEEPDALAIATTDAEAARRAAEMQAAEAGRTAGVPSVGPMDADAVPVTAAVTDTAGQPALDTAITAALAEAGAQPAVATSARPMPRPRRLAAAPAPAAPVVAETAVAAAPETAPETAPAAAPAPVKLASGAPLVQIGAFDSNSIAESEWSRVSGRYGDLFAGKAPVVQEHKAGGRVFYRLRIAGFETRDEARKFCAALIAAGTDCIPAAAN